MINQDKDTNNTDNKDNEKMDKKKPSFFVDSVLEFFKTIFSFAFFLETAKTLIICLAIVLPIRFFLIQPFYVIGASMEPNFHDHEYLIIDELSYRIRDPQRGEIVVFKYPLDTKQFFIKRIIALPGERIKISDGIIKIYNQKYPQGKAIKESAYLDEKVKTSKQVDVTLGGDEFFVLGDNRNFSLDSTNFGSVKRKLIIGRTMLRGWPFNRISYFTVPEYDF